MPGATIFFLIAAVTPWAASRFGDQPVRAGEAVAFAVLSAVWLWLMNSLRRRPAAHAWPRLVVATGMTYVLAFALLALQLDRMMQDLPASAADLKHDIGEANKQISELGNDIQALSHRLHSSKLEYLGLTAAVASF